MTELITPSQLALFCGVAAVLGGWYVWRRREWIWAGLMSPALLIALSSWDQTGIFVILGLLLLGLWAASALRALRNPMNIGRTQATFALGTASTALMVMASIWPLTFGKLSVDLPSVPESWWDWIIVILLLLGSLAIGAAVTTYFRSRAARRQAAASPGP